jgi:transposase
MRRLHLAPLPEAERRTLEELERHYPTPRVRQRATVVLMSQRGFDQTQIGRSLGVSWSFVHGSLQRYQAQGFLGLREHHPGGASHLTPAQIEQVLHWIDQGPRVYHYTFAQWDTRSLQWRIKQVYNVDLSREAIRQLLHRQGYSWKRPKATYARVDPQARQQTQTELEQLMNQAQAGRIVLLLEDEAIASLVTTLQCGWSRVRCQRKIPSLGKHDADHRCAVFGAVNPITGDVHYRIFPAINRANMKTFVGHLHRFYRNRKVPVWMVMDNHSAHKGLDAVWEAAGIHPYFLAPYCGDLNGIERLWAWLRQRQLHNVFFPSLPDLMAAIRHFFCYIAGVKKQVIARVA